MDVKLWQLTLDDLTFDSIRFTQKSLQFGCGPHFISDIAPGHTSIKPVHPGIGLALTHHDIASQISNHTDGVSDGERIIRQRFVYDGMRSYQAILANLYARQNRGVYTDLGVVTHIAALNVVRRRIWIVGHHGIWIHPHKVAKS